MSNKDLFLKQLDGIIEEFNVLSSKSQYDDLSDLSDRVEMAALITLGAGNCCQTTSQYHSIAQKR